MTLTPVLQLIHVSDIHFKDTTANPVHNLNGRRRFFARQFQSFIERYNIGGWNEGTQGHYPKAPERFCRFLEEWVQGDGRWYGSPEDSDSAQTWLIDSGDLTAFGDSASMTLGRAWQDHWCKTLNGCRSRRLYGNHDAWPGAQPIHGLLGLQSEIDAQRSQVASIAEWDTKSWIENPLTTTIPGANGSRIELYALDTVCWTALGNALAVGEIDGTKLEMLQAEIRKRTEDQPNHFRILVMHHPLAFPYSFLERHAPSMTLRDRSALAKNLRNDRNQPSGIGPLVHLFLSGHTHCSYPAGNLPTNVGDIHQGELDALQLQLVGGPLMLNQSAKAAKAAKAALGPEPVAQDPRHGCYEPMKTDATNCQAEILRFFADIEEPGNLTLIRIPIHSIDGSVYVHERGSFVTLTYCTPTP